MSSVVSSTQQPTGRTADSGSPSSLQPSDKWPLPLKAPEDSYFGDHVFQSPDGSDDVDNLSESTCEDDEIGFGHPLERMARVGSSGSGLGGLVYDIDQQVKALLKVSPCSSSLPSRSSSFTSVASMLSYDTIDYEGIVDEILHDSSYSFDDQASRNLAMYTPRPSSQLGRVTDFGPSLMVKRLPRSSPELLLLLELNHPDSREDPWNPVPHILRGVEKDDFVYLCMQGLCEFNDPPFLSVAHYVDFFRQVLESLTFLHEHRVAGLSCSEPSSYMVDLSSAPRTAPSLQNNASAIFDRFSYPVRYYFVNFAKAARIPRESLSPLSTPGTPGGHLRARGNCPFKRDVQECGALFDRLLIDVPQISQKFKSLIRAMTVGGFTADDSRRLFEAMCRSLEAHVFESKAALLTQRKVPERAHTLSHPLSTTEGLSPRFPPLEKIYSH